MTTTSNNAPVLLVICDGWGIREKNSGNAVMQAQTPVFDDLLANYERSILDASGAAVGLTPGQMGNSEVGHLNLGAGRIVYQDISRINNAIETDNFANLPQLISAVDAIKSRDAKLHLIGLLGSGGVHSHDDHLKALLEWAHSADIRPILHLITDGRDTPPNNGRDFLSDLEAQLTKTPATIATVSGRYYAMDRDKRWERTQLAFDAYAKRVGKRATSAAKAIAGAYAAGTTDEFILPHVIDLPDNERATIDAGDIVICYNFRADRMRQLVKALTLPDFDGFARQPDPRPGVITMTVYEDDLPVAVLFSKERVTQPLAHIISAHGLTQYHSAETEKYPHVTFFFNGRNEAASEGETHFMVPSPKVATYDLQPEMSAAALTDAALDRLKSADDAFLLINYANPDMVGHTGDLAAATTAVEVVDKYVGQLIEAVNAKGGTTIITADHGNAERMVEQLTGQPHTYHTTNPVSLFVVNQRYMRLRPRGILADVAPTVLDLLGIEQPEVMTGVSLLDMDG